MTHRRIWGSTALFTIGFVLSSCGEPASSESGSAGAANLDGVCAQGETLCGGVCTNTSTDPANCGSCDNACLDAACVAGQCVVANSDGTGGAGTGGAPGVGGSGIGGDLGLGGSGVGGALGSGGAGVGGALGSGGAGVGGALGSGGSGVGGALGSGGAGVGGDPGSGGDLATGGTASSQSTCVAGVDTGDACDPAVDIEVCERSDRTCVCGADSLWSCAPIGEGTGGDGTGGQGTGGEGTGGDGGSGTGGREAIGKYLGNITTGWQASLDTDGRTYSDYWDQVSPENAGKWGSVQSSAGSNFNWSTLDAIYAYTEEHDIILKEHCFLWGAQQPGGSLGENDVKNWMQNYCERYPNTAIIDVVNEPPPHTNPSYADAIGGGTNGSWQWIINAFVWAREACPNQILLLNDYNIIEWSGDTNRFIGIVQTLQNAGAPIDGIGAQAHDLDHGGVSFNTVQNLFNQLHDETGLPIYITEMDISTSDDNRQLELYQQYFPLFWESDFVPGITIWGWIYGQTWSMAPESGLIRNGSFRPAMTYLMEQVGRPTN